MADAATSAVERVAAIAGQDLQVTGDQLKAWVDGGLVPPLGGARKAGDVAAIGVGAGMVKLAQVGLAEDALSKFAQVLRTLAAGPLPEHDAWIVAVSGAAPAVICGRAQLIDALGRAKGESLVVLDVGALIRKARA